MFFIFSVVAIISFVSLYFYQLPTHHCPFCILQKEYYYIGYPLYAFLFAGSFLGIMVGVVERFKKIPPMNRIIPYAQQEVDTLLHYIPHNIHDYCIGSDNPAAVQALLKSIEFIGIFWYSSIICMEDRDKKYLLEAILFLSGEPVMLSSLKDVTEMQETELKNLWMSL